MALHVGNFGLSCKVCTKDQKIDRGCVEDSPIPERWQIGDYKFLRCPLSIVDIKSYWYIRAFNFMEKGVLPRQGGWLDQANKFMEAMSIISLNLKKE